MEAKAVGKYIRISPQKARLVADVVRGMGVDQAITTLRFMPKKGAGIIKKSSNLRLPMPPRMNRLMLIIFMLKRLLSMVDLPLKGSVQGRRAELQALLKGQAISLLFSMRIDFHIIVM